MMCYFLLIDEGYKFFEFHWFTCAPGLTHKPHNLTVTQIIPKDGIIHFNFLLLTFLIEMCFFLRSKTLFL